MANITIPKQFAGYRRRALECQAANGVHAWDMSPGAWDADRDCEAYCLDAPSDMPAGSSRSVGGTVVTLRVVRE